MVGMVSLGSQRNVLGRSAPLPPRDRARNSPSVASLRW
ncbi:Uncharacterised protein [Bordetella pertussis]|nr:Uncharacterised protein [Bordetella pertussis]